MGGCLAIFVVFEVLRCAGARTTVGMRMRLVWRCICQVAELDLEACEKRAERAAVVRIALLPVVFAHLFCLCWEKGEVNAQAKVKRGE